MRNSAKGADARRQAGKELVSPSGGVLHTATVLRGFRKKSKGADAHRQAGKELASSSGGVLHTATVLRGFRKKSKGADARRQPGKELASPSGGVLHTATVLRGFLKNCWLSLGVLALAASTAFAQFPRPAIAKGVGIDQKLNSQIPLDLVFHDENGTTVPLRTYFGDKPVVLSLVYFKCGSLCPMSIRETATALSRLPLKPGTDYDVLVVSFDPKDTPADATEKKAAFAKYFQQAGYGDGFHFLTGTQESITKLTEAVGWKYKWDDATHQFIHAGGIMVATPEGKLSRYFYGLAYAPQDVRMALVEASQHKIGSPVDYITLFCFHYDPATGKYTLAIVNLLKVAGSLTLLLLAGFIIMFIRNDKKRNSQSSLKEVPHVG